ncbi:MAG: hypothetical protein MUC81_13540 [Bacteroidia bacterium]|jgi:quercetin dioxygenase-like cupin family protein|nr:hypothetical protein [Bacteroidia bacterium]
MIIQELFQQLETSSHPVARALHKTDHSKALAIGFKKGMIMKEHKTSLPAKLFVLYGTVLYKEGALTKTLHQYEETEIPQDIIHSVECIDDALCILVQG